MMQRVQAMLVVFVAVIATGLYCIVICTMDAPFTLASKLSQNNEIKSGWWFDRRYYVGWPMFLQIQQGSG